jgi:hypothetical protein
VLITAVAGPRDIIEHVVDQPSRPQREHDRARDAAANEAARAERLRVDGTRDPGTNLEQADAHIKVAFALAAALSSPD